MVSELWRHQCNRGVQAHRCVTMRLVDQDIDWHDGNLVDIHQRIARGTD